MSLEFENYTPLNIHIKNEKDISLISSCIQGMIVPSSAINYSFAKKTLFFIGNRFCWEFVPEFSEQKKYYRIHSLIKIKNVKNIMKNIKDTKLLDIQSMYYQDKKIYIVISNQQEIKVEISTVDISLRDMQRPWETDVKPAD